MANEKEFKIKINGLEEAHVSGAKLVEVLKQMESVSAKVSVETAKTTKATAESAKATTEKAKALTEENKAQKELTQTLSERKEQESQIASEQANATQALKEKAAQLTQTIETEKAASGSMAEMKEELDALEKSYKALSEEERNSEQQGVVMLDQLREKKEAYAKLEAGIKEERESLTKSLKTVGAGVDKTTTSILGIAVAFQAAAGVAQLFGGENAKLTKTLTELGKVMTIVKALQTANTVLIKDGFVMAKAASVIDGIRIMQTKLATAATALQTKGTASATAAQWLLNKAAMANPYVLLAMAVFTVIGALGAYVISASDAKGKTEGYTSAIDGMTFATQEAADKHTQLKEELRDIQIEIDLANGKITEYDASLKRLSIETSVALDESSQMLAKNLADIDDEYNSISAIAKDVLRTNVFTFSHLWLDRTKRELADQTKAYEDNIEQTLAIGINFERNKELLATRSNKRLQAQNQSNAQKALALTVQMQKIELELVRQAETNISMTINNEFERREEQTRIRYANQRADLQKRLDEDKNLTLKAKEAISKILEAYNVQEADEIAKIKKENDDKEQTAALQTEHNKSKSRLLSFKEGSAEYIAEKEDELRIIAGMEAHAIMSSTKSEAEKASQLLIINNKLIADLAKLNGDYAIASLKEAQDKELLQEVKHLENKTIKKREYEERIRKISLDYLAKEIQLRKAQGQDTTALERQLSEKRIENSEKENNKRKEQFEEFGKKFNEIAGKVMEGVNATFGAVNAILSFETEEAKEKLATISAQYDEVVSKKEESNARISELEAEAQRSSGDRLLEVRAMIDDEMAANKQLADQKSKLAKDKEKQEKEVAQKEKQAKRSEIMQGIIGAVANTAAAVVKALPNIILAGIVGVAGAVQVGVMTAQLSKLEDGGLLRGKRHAGGGMRVEGTNIEVEGGEYVVNRMSTDKNLGLIRYINSQRRELAPQDLNAFFAKSSQGFEPPFRQLFEQGGRLPDTAPASRENYAEEFRDAIKGLKIVTVMEELRRADENYINLTERSI